MEYKTVSSGIYNPASPYWKAWVQGCWNLNYKEDVHIQCEHLSNQPLLEVSNFTAYVLFILRWALSATPPSVGMGQNGSPGRCNYNQLVLSLWCLWLLLLCSLTLLSSFSPTFVRISSPFIRSSEYESQSQWQLYKPMRDDFWPAIAGNISVQCFHPKRNWSRNESKKDADEAVRLWEGCLSCMCAPTRGIALHKDHLAQGVTSSTSQSHLACIYSDFLCRKELLKWMLGRMEASSARSDCVSAWLWSTALQLMWGHPIIVKKQNPGVLGPFHMPLSGCPPDLPTWRSLWEQWNVPLHPLLWQGSPAQSCRILFVCL